MPSCKIPVNLARDSQVILLGAQAGQVLTVNMDLASTGTAILSVSVVDGSGIPVSIPATASGAATPIGPVTSTLQEFEVETGTGVATYLIPTAGNLRVNLIAADPLVTTGDGWLTATLV